MRAHLAAKVYVVLTALVVAFQLALSAGAPWGALTMGGRYPGQLPAPMRGTALASAVLLAGMAGVVAARAGFGLPGWRRAARRLIWGVVAYGAVGVGLNAATPSAPERALWLPVACALAGCALLVARGPVANSPPGEGPPRSGTA